MVCFVTYNAISYNANMDTLTVYFMQCILIVVKSWMYESIYCCVWVLPWDHKHEAFLGPSHECTACNYVFILL